MKEIRQIKNVVQTVEEDENNNENKTIYSLDALESESGYFRMVVRPMLAPGHDSELIYWLKSMGLIQQNLLCKTCDRQMQWTPSRTMDLFHWLCSNCQTKRNIREDSAFNDVKCNFKSVLRVLLGWSKGGLVEEVVDLLAIKKHIASSLYGLAAEAAQKYIKSNRSLWKIGGPNVVIVVDSYPEGCTYTTTRCTRPIFCLAEVKDIPPKYWFEALEGPNRSAGIVAHNKIKCLETIKEMVLPGSILVVRQNSSVCSFDDVQCLKYLYPTIVSVEGMERHNTISQTILHNLSTIWNEAILVCEEAQHCQYNLVPLFLFSYLWRQMFNDESFQMILNELVT